MNTDTLKNKRKQHLVNRQAKRGNKTTDIVGEIIQLYAKDTTMENLIIGETSFWDFVNENYPLSNIFLPALLPKNNRISLDDVITLKRLIIKRDHYSIKNMIKKRYLKQGLR